MSILSRFTAYLGCIGLIFALSACAKKSTTGAKKKTKNPSDGSESFENDGDSSLGSDSSDGAFGSDSDSSSDYDSSYDPQNSGNYNQGNYGQSGYNYGQGGYNSGSYNGGSGGFGSGGFGGSGGFNNGGGNFGNGGNGNGNGNGFNGFNGFNRPTPIPGNGPMVFVRLMRAGIQVEFGTGDNQLTPADRSASRFFVRMDNGSAVVTNKPGDLTQKKGFSLTGRQTVSYNRQGSQLPCRYTLTKQLTSVTTGGQRVQCGGRP